MTTEEKIKDLHRQTIENFTAGECLRVIATKEQWDEVFIEIVKERMLKIINQ